MIPESRRFVSPITNNEPILSLIDSAMEGRIVLPDFQRSFLWIPHQLEELGGSLLSGYHIGSFLMLEMLSEKPMFPSRYIEGLEQINPHVRALHHPTIRQVLDGQQRITSLMYALFGPDIPLRGATYPHKFFLLLDKVLEGRLDEAVVGISQRGSRLRTEMDAKVARGLAIPFTLLAEPSAFHRWLYTEQTVWQGAEQRYLADVYNNFSHYTVPVVTLSTEIGIESIVSTFERINRTGTSLSVFDLAVAVLYPKGVRLRELWAVFVAKYPDASEVIKPDAILKMITILEGREGRRVFLIEVINALDVAAFCRRWEEATHALVEAYQRLVTHYGSFTSRWIPYTTLIVPLAAMLHLLKTRSGGERAYRMIDVWYWVNVFTQRYDHSADTQALFDLKQFAAWLDDPSLTVPWPVNISAEELDLDVNDSKSAVYRGLICLIALRGANDFSTGQPAILHDCDDDHIFAEAVFKRHHPVNSICNRTLLEPTTNRKRKGHLRPAEFFRQCLTEHGEDEGRLLATLDSHFISPVAYEALRRDDFEAFTTERRRFFSAAVNERLRLV